MIMPSEMAVIMTTFFVCGCIYPKMRKTAVKPVHVIACYTKLPTDY